MISKHIVYDGWGERNGNREQIIQTISFHRGVKEKLPVTNYDIFLLLTVVSERARTTGVDFAPSAFCSNDTTAGKEGVD